MENEALFQIGPCLVDSVRVTDYPEGLVIVTGLAPKADNTRHARMKS